MQLETMTMSSLLNRPLQAVVRRNAYRLAYFAAYRDLCAQLEAIVKAELERDPRACASSIDGMLSLASIQVVARLPTSASADGPADRDWPFPNEAPRDDRAIAN